MGPYSHIPFFAHFLYKARQQRLRAALDALPEGLRYREIADVLGISLGAVALIMGRSLERLGRVDR